MTLASALLAVLMIQLDLAGVMTLAPPTEGAGAEVNALRIMFGGTPEGARGMLSVIATGLITVTGVVFSVTIVALQLASTQFTPRILRNFTADRANQVVLGVFIGTFTYALLVQRTVRGEGDMIGAFVPNLSVTVALGLTMTSIGFLIFFINHAARSVQASVIIDRVTGDTLEVIHRALPDHIGEPAVDSIEDRVPEAQPTIIAAEASGYLQGVDEDRLFDLLAHDSFTLRMEPHIGDFVLPGSALASIWPAGLEQDEELAEEIREAFIFGPERTPHLDIELGVIELVDIAIKALSPAVNDPTTATHCVDRLTEILLAFARRPPPARVRRRHGHQTLLILPSTEFDHLVEIALDQIRHFGADNPHFSVTLLIRIRRLGQLLPHARHAPLARQAAALLREAPQRIEEPSDLERVERAARETIEALGPG